MNKKEFYLKWEDPKKDKIFYEDRDTLEIYLLGILESMLSEYNKELEEKDKEKFFLFLDKLLDNYTEKEYKKKNKEFLWKILLDNMYDGFYFNLYY